MRRFEIHPITWSPETIQTGRKPKSLMSRKNKTIFNDMKKITFLNLLILLIVSIPYSVQSQCPNLNFSMGTFMNWQGYMGTCNNGVNINPSAITPGRHTIMDGFQLLKAGQLYDENCTRIKKVPDGFAYAAKIGNETGGAEMEALEYTMRIDSNNSLLLLHYAWLMENPGHNAEEQPRFTMIIKDSAGNNISDTILPCAFVDFIASADLSRLVCTGSVIAQDWTTVGYSLEHLMGRTIKIYFETRDCAQSCHYSYAYIVAECRSMSIDLLFCDGQTTARFRALEGFKTYTWTRSIGKPSLIISGEGRSYQNISLSDVYAQEVITCVVESALSPECSATLNTEVKKTSIDAAFGYGIKEYGGVDFPSHYWNNWYDTCNRTATFVDRSIVINSKQASRSWFIHGLNQAFPNDSMVTITFPDPGIPQNPNNPNDKGKDSVRYLVRLTVQAENGCMDTSKSYADHYITIYASPRVEITGVTEICQREDTLRAKAIRSQFVDYKWGGYDIDGGTYSSTDTFLIISKPGTYYIEATNIDGCIVRDTHIVTHLAANFDMLEIQSPSCYGGNDGGFSYGVITGGQPPYQSFIWVVTDTTMWQFLGNQWRYDSTENAYIDPWGSFVGKIYYNLPAGTFSLEAVDSEGCIIQGKVEITQPELLEIYRSQNWPYNNDEDIFIYAIGGTAPYNYTIAKDDGSFSVNSDSATGLSAGTYIISVTDANACFASGTIVIEIKKDTIPTYISGAIRVANNSDIVSGKVYLYSADPNAMRYLLADSVNIQSEGTYTFTPVAEGNYLLKAVATNIPNAIPTYYGNTDNWSLATTVSILNNSYWRNMNIEMIILNPLTGNSVISGYVGEDDDGTKSIHKSGVEYPSVGVTVLLKIKETLETIARTQTNEEGFFEFRNVPVGNYIVVIDIPGLGMIDFHEIEITEDGQVVEDLNYTVTEDGIVTEGSTNSIIQLSSDAMVKLYPNPVTNMLHIQSSLAVEQISIYDISGRMLKQIPYPKQEINVTDLANGIYLVKVKMESGDVIKKLVKE
jgi:hypothetical protein